MNDLVINYVNQIMDLSTQYDEYDREDSRIYTIRSFIKDEIMNLEERITIIEVENV